jgi:hypothetical protein
VGVTRGRSTAGGLPPPQATTSMATRIEERVLRMIPASQNDWPSTSYWRVAWIGLPSLDTQEQASCPTTRHDQRPVGLRVCRQRCGPLAEASRQARQAGVASFKALGTSLSQLSPTGIQRIRIHGPKWRPMQGEAWVGLTDSVRAFTLWPTRLVRRKEVHRETCCSKRSPEPLRSSRLARPRL